MPTKQQTKKQIKNAAKLIDRWLDYQVYVREVPGMAAGIVHDGEVIYSNTFGYADIRRKEKTKLTTCYHIASISKTFTATAIMQLTEQGKLQLDDKVGKHLSWFTSQKDKNVQAITIRQLLSHSSGISRDGNTPHWETDKFPSLQQIKDFVSECEVTAYAPLERFKYSNFGYAILGEVIAEVSGLSYAEYVEKNIVKKLGLKHTSVEESSKNKNIVAIGYERKLPGKQPKAIAPLNTQAFAPAAGVVSNVPDLCKYMAAQLPGNTKLLTEESKRDMQRIQWLRGEGEKIHYGLGYEILQSNGKRLYGHGGGFSGYSTYIRMDAKNNISIAILTNTIDSLPFMLMESAFAILYHFIENNDSIQETKKQTHAKKYKGRFTSRWGETDIVEIDGRLFAFSPGVLDPNASLSPLEPLGQDKFRITEGDDFDWIGETMRYEFDKQGRTKKVYWGPNPLKPFRP